MVNSLPLYLVPERLKRALGVAKHIFIQDGVSPNILLFCNEEVEVEFFKDASLIKEKEGLILMRSRDKERDRGKRKIFLSMSRYDLIDITMRLEQDGNCVYPFPSISFKPLVKEIKIPDVDWIVFTSKVGVNYFFKFLSDDIRKLDSMKIACVGKKTEEALNSFGIEADVVPETFRGEDLLETLIKSNARGKRVLLPQAEETRGILEKGLKEEGAEVRVLPLYRNIVPPLCYAFLERAKNAGYIDYAMFTSPSTVQHTIKLFGDMWKEWSRNVGLFVAIGPVTAKVLERWGKVVYPEEFTIQNMLEFVYERGDGRVEEDS